LYGKLLRVKKTFDILGRKFEYVIIYFTIINVCFAGILFKRKNVCIHNKQILILITKHVCC